MSINFILGYTINVRDTLSRIAMISLYSKRECCVIAVLQGNVSCWKNIRARTRADVDFDNVRFVRERSYENRDVFPRDVSALERIFDRISALV